MSITIKDIAKEVGVSVSTVSRILSGKSVQNKKLIKLVKDKAEALNYRVNTAAVGLRTNKTKLIGIVVPELNNEFFSEITAAIEEVLEAKGYNILICQTNESPDKEKKLIRSLISCNVEGILISSSIHESNEEVASEALALGKKVVLFDRVPAYSKLPFVSIQDFDGGYKVAKHVLDQGRSKIIFHGLNEHLANNQERLAGVNAALLEAGVEIVDAVYYPADFSQYLKNCIHSGRCDALICYNDDIAARDIVFLKNAAIKVPEEVIITGFDNRSICGLVSPTLTTIDHSTNEIGKKASELLLSMIESKNEKLRSVVIPASLIVRESSK